jgi:hypothetical protein
LSCMVWQKASLHRRHAKFDLRGQCCRDGKVNLSMFLRRNTRVGSAVGITLRVARQQNKSQNEACWRVE